MSLIERIWPSIFEWNLAYTLLWIKLPLFQWADTVGFAAAKMIRRILVDYARAKHADHKRQPLAHG